VNRLTGSDNRIGYDGYVYNPQSLTYLVRNRTYNTSLGRWHQRDPAGYVDGMNLYECVKNSPIYSADPYGLMASNSEFVLHYYLGDGATFYLAARGLGNAYRSHGAVRSAVHKLESVLETSTIKRARGLAGKLDCIGPCAVQNPLRSVAVGFATGTNREGVQRADFVRAYPKLTPFAESWFFDWTFSIGGHQLFQTMLADCTPHARKVPKHAGVFSA